MTEQELKNAIEAFEMQTGKKVRFAIENGKRGHSVQTSRDKWFGKYQRDCQSLMGTVFVRHLDENEIYGCYPELDNVWKTVLRLTLYICGCRHEKDVKPEYEIDKICDKLCQTIYELRKEFIERTETTDNEE